MSSAMAAMAPVTLTGIRRLRRSLESFDSRWISSQYLP